MSDLTKNQQAVLDKVKAAGGPVVLSVTAARVLVDKGLIRSDGTKGHGRAKAAYFAA